MEYLRALKDFKRENGSVVTFGKFDGLHRGHQMLIETVRHVGRRDGLTSVVCALNMDVPAVLMLQEERCMHLDGRVDVLLDCPFTEELRNISAEDFIRDIIVGVFRAQYIVIGTDFSFGKDKRGNSAMLCKFKDQYGYKVLVGEKVCYQRMVISSTYIKGVLREGQITVANACLGYAYGVSGIVESGQQLGRKLGVPTINIQWPECKLSLRKGVYVCRLLLDEKITEDNVLDMQNYIAGETPIGRTGQTMYLLIGGLHIGYIN